ncbi:MAG: hypothetical protein ACPH9N_05690 [Alteromonas sp.]
MNGYFKGGGPPWLEDTQLMFVRSVYAQPIVVRDSETHPAVAAQYEIMTLKY